MCRLSNKKNGWTGLELGPGDGLLSAFLAPALGSQGLTMVDSGDYAHKDVGRYHYQIQKFLESFPDLKLPDITMNHEINMMLSSVGGSYHSKGLSSLSGLKENSYDLIFSQAVLEHVRQNEFKDLMIECYRLLAPSGTMSHIVDFKDHLGGGLNNMRFSSYFWEKDWFASDSGFYTNRIRLQEIISICEDIGFVIEVDNLKRWCSLPIKRSQLAKEFRNLTDADLLISEAHLLMKLK